MHGLGNDFVVIDRVTHHLRLKPEQVKYIADRRFGIGCDQLLIVEAPVSPQVDFFCHIFNADGGEASQCGNGMRCIAKYVYDAGLTFKKDITIETIAGVVEAIFREDSRVSVNMGQPKLHPAKIPFLADIPKKHYALEMNGSPLVFIPLSMGNPHAVIEVENLTKAPVDKIGGLLNKDKRFPKGVNVEFVEIIDSHHIRLRVFERGVGETMACGTGACAAVVAGRLNEKLDAAVRVELPGGELDIEWAGEGSPVWMTGPAVTVYKGQIQL